LDKFPPTDDCFPALLMVVGNDQTISSAQVIGKDG
jgi:hypothetical protein